MNGINVSEALSWLIFFLGALMTLSLALHTTVEVVVKPVLKKAETQFGISPGFRKWLLPVGAFLAALYTVFEGQINLFADMPLDIFNSTPDYFVWAINAALIAGGSFIEHTWWERIIAAAEKGKELSDIFSPQDTAQAVRVSRP